MKIFWMIMCMWLLGCGGAKQPEIENEKAATEPTAVWEEDVEDAAYKFYRSVSKTLLRTNQPHRAAQNIRRLFKLKPDEAEPRFLMGQAYVAMGQYDMAIRMFEDALKRDDDYAPAHSMLGGVLNTLGEHALATESHLRAIDLDEENASYRNNLGFSYYLQKKYKAAVTAYLAALDIDPGLKRVHNNLGFAYGKLGELASAERHFKMAGLPAQANNNMGFVYESRGEYERAYEYYVVALKQNPSMVQAKENLTRVCERLGRPVPELAVTITNETAEASVLSGS